MTGLSLADPAAKRGFLFTFVGEGGMGKTTLAGMFPNPVFIPTEEGLIPQHIPRFPLQDNSQGVIDCMHQLANVEHDRQTVVTDSVTQLNQLIEQEIIASDPKNPSSINTALGGYGAGHAAVASRHMEIRNWAGQLSQRGMNIVFLAHADQEMVTPPDADQYSRYSIRMNKRSVSHYSDNVDCVGYLKLDMVTRSSGERKLAFSTGKRVIVCYPTVSNISKNRFGITQDIPFDLTEFPFQSLFV